MTHEGCFGRCSGPGTALFYCFHEVFHDMEVSLGFLLSRVRCDYPRDASVEMCLIYPLGENPAEFERKALHPDIYIDKIKEQKHSQAKAVLKANGFDCEIVPTSDTDVVLMENNEAQKKMDSTELYSTSYYYPMFLGVVMYKQNGIYTVYERRADVEKGRYYFAQYENGSTEAVAHAFDKNGDYIGQEEITVKNFFDYDAPKEDTALYYIFDESRLTTHAIILEEGETLATDVTPPEPTTNNLFSQETSVTD